MKTPGTTNAVSSATQQGAQILPFRFPTRTKTACDEILARMLSREVLTGMDGVFEGSATRLTAHVHYLAESYGVTIEAKDRAVGCNDGRVATVKAYSMPHSVIQCAQAAGTARRSCPRPATGRAHGCHTQTQYVAGSRRLVCEWRCAMSAPMHLSQTVQQLANSVRISHHLMFQPAAVRRCACPENFPLSVPKGYVDELVVKGCNTRRTARPAVHKPCMQGAAMTDEGAKS